MSRLGNAVRALAGAPVQRDASLGALLGDRSRVYHSLAPTVTQEGALRNSVWWAGLNMRANIVSTFPVDVVRDTGDGITQSVKNPGPMVSTPWINTDITEFLYSTQMDKDRYGNAVGIIRERNAYGLPTAVELQLMANCAAIMDGPTIRQWRCGRDYYDVKDIWHEKQYTVAGLALGLSPLAYAAAGAMSVAQLSEQFAINWFGNGATPRGVLKNNKREKLNPKDVENAKRGFQNATAGGEIFVHGAEWEWLPAQTSAATAGFLAQRSASDRDVARFVGVPAGMIDVEVATGNITYANVTQFNLHMLVNYLGPSVARTQNFWTNNALPKPWKFRLNTDALLRMDPTAKADIMVKLMNAKLRTPDEIRALDNLPPYTPEQISQVGTFAQMSKTHPAAAQTKEVQPWSVPS
jgi:HK97 family phage portal protein